MQDSVSCILYLYTVSVFCDLNGWMYPSDWLPMQIQNSCQLVYAMLWLNYFIFTLIRKVNKTICYVKQKLVLRKWSFPAIGSDTPHIHTHNFSWIQIQLTISLRIRNIRHVRHQSSLTRHLLTYFMAEQMRKVM